MRSLLTVLVLFCAVVSQGCASTDPRCTDLCQVPEPGPLSRSTCSGDSISTCIDSCQVRISGVSSLCASCLLEEARFGGGPVAIEFPMCGTDAVCAPQQRCSWGGECSFCADDTASSNACFRATHPLVEEACSPSFRPVSECATLCGG